MKKFLIFLMVVTLLVSLVGCEGNDTDKEIEDSESAYTEEKSDVESAVNNETEGDNIEEELLDDSIKVENGIAYFDMGVEGFVEAYNNSLTSEADYISNNLSNPRYINSGIGVQQKTIYQYDVSNGLTKVHTFVSTDENEKIVELCIGIEKQFGKPTVDIDTALYECLGGMALVLTDLSINEWDVLVKGLKRKIEANERAFYYHKGIGLDGHENDIARYYRISCMTEELYNNLK